MVEQCYNVVMKNLQKGFAPVALIVIFAVAVIAGGGTVYYKNRSASVSNSNQKDCGKDFDCFISAARTCSLAKIDITTTVNLSAMFGVPSSSKEPPMLQTQRVVSEIRGIKDGECVYWQKLVDVQNPAIPPEVISQSLKEGEMTCSYPSADLVVRLKNGHDGNASISFDSLDSYEQRVAKQCKNFGISPEGSTTFPPKPAISKKLTPNNLEPRTMSYDVTVDGSAQRQRAFGNKKEIAFEAGNIGADSVGIAIFDKVGNFVKIVTLRPGESAIVLNKTIMLKSIKPTQIVLKITETY
jgi:hypothetical protein